LKNNGQFSEINYHSICSEINFIEKCKNFCGVEYYLKFSPAAARIGHSFHLTMGFEVGRMRGACA
jgi:hypothetical protein